jgi:streptomycin 6-kinase
MNRSGLPIPADVRRTVVDWSGVDGQRWLAHLPEVVGRLAQEWRLTAGAPLGGGSASLVLEVTRADGTPAVLKVPCLDEESRTEPDALRHYDGAGAVRLYDVDRHSGAMLLERVRPGTSLAMHPDADEALEIACRLLRRLWRPPKAPHPVPERVRPGHDMGAGHSRQTRSTRQPLSAWLDRAGGEAGPHFGTGRWKPRGRQSRRPPRQHPGVGPGRLASDRSKTAGRRSLFRRRLFAPGQVGATPSPAAADRLVGKLARGLEVDATRVRGWAILRAVDNALWALDVRASPAADLAKAAVLDA